MLSHWSDFQTLIWYDKYVDYMHVNISVLCAIYYNNRDNIEKQRNIISLLLINTHLIEYYTVHIE